MMELPAYKGALKFQFAEPVILTKGGIKMWLLVIFCLLLGLFIGFQIPVFYLVYSKYMSIAILAALTQFWRH